MQAQESTLGPKKKASAACIPVFWIILLVPPRWVLLPQVFPPSQCMWTLSLLRAQAHVRKRVRESCSRSSNIWENRTKLKSHKTANSVVNSTTRGAAFQKVNQRKRSTFLCGFSSKHTWRDKNFFLLRHLMIKLDHSGNESHNRYALGCVSQNSHGIRLPLITKCQEQAVEGCWFHALPVDFLEVSGWPGEIVVLT